MRNSELWRASLKKRKYWLDSELEILKQNPEKSAKELAVVLGRSEYQAAQKLRTVRGTANRRFKEGWDVPSKELAYFLGGVASDCGVYTSILEMSQKDDNTEFFQRMALLVEQIFGLKPLLRRVKRTWTWQGVKKERYYDAMYVCSDQFLKCLGTDAAIQAGNLKWRDGGDWSEFIDAKFSWVWQDEFFWSFIGGLYDGDGSLIRKNMSHVSGGIWYQIGLAVGPEIARNKLKDELIIREFQVADLGTKSKIVGLTLTGGQSEVDRFLSKVECVIPRKKAKYL